MNEAAPNSIPLGIFDSVRAMLDTLLEILHDRGELFTVEIDEGLRHLFRVLLWGLVAVFCVIIAATFLGAALLLAAPPEYRLLSALGLVLFFLIVAGVGYLAIRRNLRTMPRPFADTLRELEKDRAALRSRL